MKKCNQNWTSI